MTKDSKGFGDLYVMQAQCGLVKVGRSSSSERRCTTFEQKLRQPVALLTVLPGRGADEETMHIKLQRHLVIGEWFYGTEAGKAAVAKVLNLSKLSWPFDWDAAASDELRRNMEIANYRKRVFGRRRKLVATIVGGTTNKFTNMSIWSSLDDGYITRSDHGTLFTAVLGEDGQCPLPNYLADADAARSLGLPEWSMPPGAASAAEIVVAALEALILRPRVE